MTFATAALLFAAGGSSGTDRSLLSGSGPIPEPGTGASAAQRARWLMRALLQRVGEAAVEVDGQTTGRIGRGWLVLLGVGHADSEATAIALADKAAGLRCFEDAQGKTNLSAADIGAAWLVVSQLVVAYAASPERYWSPAPKSIVSRAAGLLPVGS